MTNYNGKEVLNGLLFIKSMMSVENVERQAIALRKLLLSLEYLESMQSGKRLRIKTDGVRRRISKTKLSLKYQHNKCKFGITIGFLNNSNRGDQDDLG